MPRPGYGERSPRLSRPDGWPRPARYAPHPRRAAGTPPLLRSGPPGTPRSARSKHQRGDSVMDEDSAHWVEQQRDPECPREKDRFTGHQGDQIRHRGAADSVAADSARDQPSEIVDELPP